MLIAEVSVTCQKLTQLVFFDSVGYLVSLLRLVKLFFKYLVDFPIFLLEIEEKKSRTPFFLQYLLVSWTRIVDL